MNRRVFLSALAALPTAWTFGLSRSPLAANTPPVVEPPEPPWPEDDLAHKPSVWVDRWNRAPRVPIWESADPVESQLLQAIHQGLRLHILTFGGTRHRREITPTLLFQSEGFPGRYLLAHCHYRSAARTFRVDRILRVTLVPPVSGVGVSDRQRTS